MTQSASYVLRMLPSNIVIQIATNPQELPKHIAKQIGPMFLRRYNPSPVPPAQRGFKNGTWKGVLVWALRDDGKVVGWAIRAKPAGKSHIEVMTFVRAEDRRKGIGDAMLDKALEMGPEGLVAVYPHSKESTAFYNYREKKINDQMARAAG